ncbi:unnamed protein product, partial [Ectocarpus sp. 12 AP-2014]
VVSSRERYQSRTNEERVLHHASTVAIRRRVTVYQSRRRLQRSPYGATRVNREADMPKPIRLPTNVLLARAFRKKCSLRTQSTVLDEQELLQHLRTACRLAWLPVCRLEANILDVLLVSPAQVPGTLCSKTEPRRPSRVHAS